MIKYHLDNSLEFLFVFNFYFPKIYDKFELSRYLDHTSGNVFSCDQQILKFFQFFNQLINKMLLFWTLSEFAVFIEKFISTTSVHYILKSQFYRQRFTCSIVT